MTDHSLQNHPVLRWLMVGGVVALIALIVLLPPVFADALMLVALVVALAVGARTLRLRQREWRVALPIRRVLVVLAALLMAIAAVFFTPTDSVAPITPDVQQGLLATLGGIVLLFFALIGKRLTATSVHPLSEADDRVTVRVFASQWHKLATFCGALTLLFVAEASANLFHVTWLRFTPSHHQFALLVIGIALVAWGLGAPHTRRAHPLRVTRWELVLIMVIGAGALFVRVWELDTRLLTLVDELNFISHVIHFWEFEHNPLVHPMTGVVPFTRLFAYWESWTVALFGRDLAGIRMASTVIGTLNVVAVWWLARHLFNRHVALIAAVLLATFPMHIHFSRVALNNIVDPLFGTLALAFLVRGLQSRSRWDFALAGVCFGLIPYFYEAGRLMFPLMVVGWLVWINWIGRRKFEPQTRWSLVAMGVIVVLIAMPVYYNSFFITGNLGGRLTFVSLGPDYFLDVLSGDTGGGGYVDNIARSFLLYVNRWETFIHYGGVQPLVLTVFVPFFLLGSGYALHGTLRRHPGAALILLWFVMVGMGNTVLADPAVTTRHVVSLPAVAILLALGVYETVRLVVGRESPYPSVPSPSRWGGEASLSEQGRGKPANTEEHASSNVGTPPVASELSDSRDVPPRSVWERGKPANPEEHDPSHVGTPPAESELSDSRDVPPRSVWERGKPANPEEHDPSNVGTPPVASELSDSRNVPPRPVWERGLGGEGKNSHRAVLLVAMIITLIIGVRQVDYYFNDHLPLLEVQIRELNPYRDVTDALIRASDLAPGTHVTLITEYTYSGRDSFDFLRYVADDMTIATFLNGQVPDDYFETLDISQPQAFFIAPENDSTPDDLRPIYGDDLPAPQPATNPNVPADERFDLYTFPPGAYTDYRPPEQGEHIPYTQSLVRFYGTVFVMSVVGAGAWIGWRRRPSFRLRLPKIDIGTFPPSDTLARWALIVALVLLGIAVFAWSPSRLGSAGIGALMAAGSCAALGVALLTRPLRLDDRVPIAGTIPSFILHPNRLILGVILLIPVVIVNASRLDDNGIHVWAQMVLFIAGIVLVANGFGRGYRLPNLRDHRNEALLLAGIVLLGIIVRVVNLEYGVHRFIDEMHSVEAVNNLNDNPYTPLLSQHGEVPAFTWLYALLQTATVSFYGPSLTGLRVVSVVFGVLTIPAVWWLARLHFDRRTALLAALLLATFPPHIHFSRVGLNNIVDPLLGVLALAFITRGVQTGNDRDFALGGLMLGLTQYFYEGGRLLYPPLIAVFVVLWVLRGPRHWRGFAVLGLVFVIVAAPVYLAWESNDYDNTPRLTTKTDDDNFYAVLQEDGFAAGVERFAETVYRPAWLLVQHPDEGWFYGGDRALILPLIVPLFLLGVFHALFRVKKVGMAVLLVWVLAALVGNALLVDRMDSPRYVVIFPALMMLVAVGIRYMLAQVNARRTALVMLVLGVVIAGWQTVYYFNAHLPRFNDQYRSATVFDDVLFRIATLPRFSQVYVITNQAGLAFQDVAIILRFHDRQDDIVVTPYERQDFLDDFIADLPTTGRLAFFYQAQDRSTRMALQDRFDHATIHTSPYDSLPENQQFHLMFVVRSD